MSNAVTSLAAAIVPSDLQTSSSGSSKISLSNSFNSSTGVKQEHASDSPSPNKLSSSSCLTVSSLSSSSSNSEVNSGSSNEERSNQIMNTDNNVNNNINHANKTNKIINTNYYHPNQQQLVNELAHHQFISPHAMPLGLSHYNLNQAAAHLNGIQYIQSASINGGGGGGGSPLSSSLTSSPSSANTSIQYLSPQQFQSKGFAHHSANTYSHHHHHQQQQQHPIHVASSFNGSHQLQQQQQFQQLQQFHSQFHTNYKDTRWLTLEVCREFQRNKCNRSDTECKFAHPPAHVEIINGKVIACYDSLKVNSTTNIF